MSFESLDEINLKLLEALKGDSRLSFAELGRRVGLSAPAVAERVRKMEEAGIICGYRVVLNPVKLGNQITAFIRLSVPAEIYPRITPMLISIPQVLECYHVAGGDSFVIKLVAASLAQLEEIIGKLSPYGQTITSIVLSTVLERDMPLPPFAGSGSLS